LRKVYPNIQALGASLIAISPQLQHFNLELITERKLPFQVYSDVGNTVAASFGVAYTLPNQIQWVYQEKFNLDIPRFNGDDSWVLPMPSRFIIDKNMTIQTVEATLDHTTRPEPDTLIEVLKTL
jgi:peroxiredoxin